MSRARARLLGVLLLAIAVPLMVGMFPPDHPSGYGRLLDLFFKHVPGAIAFRTTYKIAPVALLGFALLIGLGVSAVSPRLAGRHRWLAIGLCSLGAVVVVATTLPAWTGNLFPTPVKIPDYWTQAGTDLNAGPTDSRLLVVPGSDGAEYRWSGKSPDDIFNLVLTTPTVSRLTVSAGAIYPANFLAALDVALNTNRAKGTTTSTMSRYLGAGNVLERNDMTWEDIRAGRPSDIHAQLVADPGLALQQVFGAPGENTTRTDGSDPKPDASARDALLPPLQLFGVKQPVATARAESAEQAVVIDGDNFALPTLTQLGMMADNPSYLLAGNMTSADLATAIASGDRLVITDTNRRRLASVHAVDDSYSVTLDPSGPVTGQTATSTTLWPLRPETQTVAELADVSSITATRAGAEFTLAPTGQPTAAFDGDPQSVWVASTFGNAAGQGIKVALEHPTPVRKVAVDVYPTDPAAVTSLLVRAGGWTNLVPVPSDGHVEVQIPDVVGDVSDLNVSIAGVRGRGTVGISEITIDGVKPVLYARMPTTISDLARSLSPDEAQQLAVAPLDLVMSRQVGPPGLPTQDEERVLNRQFDLPGDRTFTLAGQLSADEPLNEAALWADSAGVATGSCVPIGTLDGQPFDVRFDASPSATQPGVLLSFTQCGASIDLTAGTHRLTTNAGFPVATMRFSSGTPSPPTATAPALTVLSRSNTDLHARTEGGTGAFFLVTGHAYDPRWVATVDGKPLGTPTVVDGYSTGWRIDEAGQPRHPGAVLPSALDERRAGGLGRGRAAVRVPLLPTQALDAHEVAAVVRLTPRAVLGWLALAAVLWFLNGTMGLVVAVAIGTYLLLDLEPVLMIGISVVLFAAIPVFMIIQGLATAATVDPRIVQGWSMANSLAFAGLACLVVGVIRAVPTGPLVGRLGDVMAARARTEGEGGASWTAPSSRCCRSACPSGRATTRTCCCGPPNRPREAAAHLMRGGAWTTANVALQALTGAGFWLFASRIYSPVSVGLASALFSSLLFVNFITGMGLPVTIPLFAGSNSEEDTTILSWALIYTTATSAVGTVVYLVAVSSAAVVVLRQQGGALGWFVFFFSVAGASVGALADVRLMIARRWGLVLARNNIVGVIRIAMLFLPHFGNPALWLFAVGALPVAVTGVIAIALLPRWTGVRFRLGPSPGPACGRRSASPRSTSSARSCPRLRRSCCP